jgi:dTMP kinase
MTETAFSGMAGGEKGVFVTLEGIDGCGKSTQAERLRERLERSGRRVLRTFEPGGWEGGAPLRRLLLREGETPLSARTELLLFLADRSGHLDAEIAPALEEGRWVVCERYTDSTLAYQSWGRGIPLGEMEGLLGWCRFPAPDLTLFLDIGEEEAASRLDRRRGRDRIEAESAREKDFMARVARGYRELAKRNPERIVAVDAGADVESVTGRIFDILARRLRGFSA